MRRVIRRAIGWCAALLALAVLLGLPVYVFPPQDPVDGVDTVFVLGPPTWQRIDLARELVESGGASRVLVSVSPTGRQSADLYPPCAWEGFTCSTPEPFTTKGEVKMLREFLGPDAADEKVAVVTFTPHVARARFIFQRCFGPNVSVVGVSQDMDVFDWIYEYVYQSAAFVKAALKPCAE